LIQAERKRLEDFYNEKNNFFAQYEDYKLKIATPPATSALSSSVSSSSSIGLVAKWTTKLLNRGLVSF